MLNDDQEGADGQKASESSTKSSETIKSGSGAIININEDGSVTQTDSKGNVIPYGGTQVATNKYNEIDWIRGEPAKDAIEDAWDAYQSWAKDNREQLPAAIQGTLNLINAGQEITGGIGICGAAGIPGGPGVVQAGGGASLENISTSDMLRIRNAANRTG